MSYEFYARTPAAECPRTQVADIADDHAAYRAWHWHMSALGGSQSSGSDPKLSLGKVSYRGLKACTQLDGNSFCLKIVVALVENDLPILWNAFPPNGFTEGRRYDLRLQH